MCVPVQTKIRRISMASGNAELAGSIHKRLLAMESQESLSLVEMLACESMMHSQRLWSILQSPLRIENVIGYINTLSAQQKKLLVGRVALSLLRKICAFMEDDDNGHPKSHLGNGAHGNFHHGAIKISSWNENFEPEVPKCHIGNKASELCHIDAALVLLIVAEAHEWNEEIAPRRYVCENILKMGYSVPGLMVDEVGLRSSIDLLCRYERLLQRFLFMSETTPPPPPASAATILSLPSAIYTCEGGNESRVVCSVCGDALQSRLSVASCLPCSHVYHWECIHSWLKTRNTCPLCRHELPTDDVIYEVARHMRRIFC